jgi:hypothetical protein
LYLSKFKIVIQRGCKLPRVVANAVIGDNCEAYSPSSTIHNSVIVGTLHQDFNPQRNENGRVVPSSLKLKNCVVDKINGPGSVVMLSGSSSARSIVSAKGLKLIDSIVGNAFISENVILGKGGVFLGVPSSSVLGTVVMRGPFNTIGGEVSILGRFVGKKQTNIPIIVENNFETNRLAMGQCRLNVDKMLKPDLNNVANISNPTSVIRKATMFFDNDNNIKLKQALNFRENNINHDIENSINPDNGPSISQNGHQKEVSGNNGDKPKVDSNGSKLDLGM